MKRSGGDEDRKFYVYSHLRKTDRSVFYIGKGSGSRCKSKSGRNRHWHNIVKKNGYLIEIIKDKMTNEEACSLEIKLIKENRSDLCNVASGGESGLVGIKLTDEHKEKLRIAKLGKKQSKEHAERSAMAKVGKKQPRDAVEETISKKRKKVINSNGEVFKSASDAARELTKRIGVNASQGNISMCCNGCRNEAYGMSWSYDTSNTPDSPSGITASMKRIKCSNGMEFNSTMDATRWVKSWRGKSSNQTITACARGIANTAYGFKWQYIA